MKKLYAAMMFAGIFLLSACNGSSGENDSSPAPTPIASSVSLALYDANGVAKQSFSSDETITLTATVRDDNNTPIAGRAVAFNADIGVLSVTSKLTDSRGEATITLTNSTFAVGAGSATATANDISSTIDYEFLSIGSTNPPSISTEIRLDGVLINQFKTSEQVQISATLIDHNNQPVAGEIIAFTADIGELATATALTNEQGTANVVLTGNGDIGAGVLTANINDSTSVTPSRVNYEILADDAVIIDEGIRIGHFDGNDFIEGKIKLSIDDNTISAGGTLGLSVDLTNNNGELINTPTPVSFTSNCVQSQHAGIDETVLSIKGKATSTYEDIDCAGVSGSDDVIVASITVNGVTSVASETISITGEELGSIEFISAEPTSIVLKGTGGQGKQETSILTFQVKSALGNPLAQQAVSFILDTNAGGIELTPMSGLTNSQGMITTIVKAGTVPTAVRVTARSTMTIGNDTIDVQTQSDLLSINTGLPEQSSMTISTSIVNPEAYDFNDATALITAQLADNFNNPVPDGTTVNFTAEGGTIGSTCITVNGACSVDWISSNPKPDNHRITVLATASGHETFFESNGNNFFDDDDGVAHQEKSVSSGAARITPMASGFIDMSEAWRDDDEDDAYDDGEKYIDFNNDKTFSAPDGLFNGPQCQGALCAPEGTNEIHVRKSLVMIMSSTAALVRLVNANTNTVYVDNNAGINGSLPDIADGSSLALRFEFADTALQTLPMGTSIRVSIDGGELKGTTSYDVGNTGANGYKSVSFLITNASGGDPETASLLVSITTPRSQEVFYINEFVDLL
ncbi:Ig-like domain-containing protein [Thalassotalea atypica]|uniref:Ig-like domain-containing protein n=1 Tax=Thalassotalea atypica TaxID=2054316 RepID=UPI002573861C|nr:Ig-like domain-containing protein [Thalassotalea atypica]